jgi:hypothetical protein
MPPLLGWLSNVFVSPFTMDVDERLRFTIVITHQSIYWSVKQTTEALSTSRRRAGQQDVGAGTRRPLPATGLPAMA